MVQPGQPVSRARNFLRMAGILVLCTLVGRLFFRLGFMSSTYIMVYLVGVLCTAMFTTGRWYCLLASVLSVLLVNYFFTEPYGTFRTGPDDVVALAVMFVVALLVSSLTTSLKQQSLERERANEARRQMEAAARQEQLRANLLRSISHDLRTPLTSISGNAAILMDSGAQMTEPKRQELYAAIRDDAQWLSSLVENMLSITRMENGQLRLNLEPELLEDVFHEALAHLDRAACRHTLVTDLPDDLLMARMDAHLIVQVILNLVNNAVKYTPDGSRITLAARAEGDFVRVSVTDDGPGVPEESRDKLFEMFYTLDNARGDGRRGLGLGLSLCRSIVTAHGGQIEVHNVQPHGACFSFTLPLSEVTIHE